MMTAFALARICQELFGDVEYAAIDTDRNKYPIGLLFCFCYSYFFIVSFDSGSGRVVFVNAHSYYAAVTVNYLMIDCDKFCKVVRTRHDAFSTMMKFVLFTFRSDSN